MIGFLLILFTSLIVFFAVILVPFGLILGFSTGVIMDYQSSTNKRDKIHVLCSPLMLATPFIYYHFINDSLWQALLSLLIVPTLVEAIWGENGFINARRK
ncbi:hypothetical protein ACLSZW_05425 [Avibacterium avium]|uniref:hypothetical protein n=1 Tax=Avibacterium avium TaxID=751 RepID=UPI003BF8EED5